MNSPVVIIGIGEMGGVFARGLLRAGRPVYPVTRDMDPQEVAAELPGPELALLAVAEADLHANLKRLPDPWRDRLVLLQNELLPRDWEQYGLSPTVISVWFEKKPGQDAKVLIPSPVYGPKAPIIAGGLDAIGIPTRILEDLEELLFELVRKNLYILTTNIAGLVVGGTVEDLRRDHSLLMHEVAQDVLAIQEYLSGEKLPWERLIEAMLEAFEGDPYHKCMGRSAPARLKRALAIADEAGLAVHQLREIAENTSATKG